MFLWFRDHPFSACAKFFGGRVRLRVRGKEYWFFGMFCVRAGWMARYRGFGQGLSVLVFLQSLAGYLGLALAFVRGGVLRGWGGGGGVGINKVLILTG